MTPKKFFHWVSTNSDSVVVWTANGFKGTPTVTNHETSLEIWTTVNWIMKGDGNSVTSAVPGTDYAIPSQLVKYYKNQSLQTSRPVFHDTVWTVSGGSGICTFNLADSAWNAVFTDLTKEWTNFYVNSQTAYAFDQWTLSSDKKTLTVRVSYPSISALVLVYWLAANGTTVYLQAKWI